MKKTKFVKFLVPLFALLLASCAMTPQDLSSSSEPGAGESSSAEPSSEDHSSEDPSSEDVSEETSSEDPSLPDSSDPGTSEEDPVEPGSSEDVPGSSEEDPIEPGSSEDVPGSSEEDPTTPGSSEEDPDQPGSSNPEVSNLITVYFKAPENWGSTINAYAWGDSGSNASWPGVAMQDQGDRLYSYELDYTVYPNIIFNDGTSQTGDLKTPTDPDMALYVNGTGWVETGSDIDPEITLDGWYIVGEGGFVDGPSWKPDGGIYLAPNESYEGDGSEYFATDVKFTQGDLWKICSTENVWVDNGYESDVGAFGLKQMQMDGQNVKVNTTGLYDVYFKISSDNAYSCYISEEKSTNPDEPDVPGTDEGHNASEIADIIKETAHATNGTVDYAIAIDDQSQSITYKTTGDTAVIIEGDKTQYLPESHNQYHMGYINLVFQCASDIVFDGFSHSNGVYTATSAKVTLSKDLYLSSAYAMEGEKFENNVDIEIEDVFVTLNDGYVDMMRFTSPSIGIGKSPTTDGGEQTSCFLVNKGFMMTCAFGFYDMGTTTIAPNPGEGGGEGDEPVDTLIDIFFVKPTNWAETINAYAWDDKGSNNATWPGVAMNNLGDGLYHIELDYTVYPNIIFNDGSNQTENLKTPTDPDMSLYVLGTGWIETGSDTPEIKEEWYIVGEGSFVNEKPWSYEGGIYLAPNESYEGDGEEYYATDVKFTEGDLWKVCSMNGTWIDKGYEIDNGAFALKQMEMDGQNIKVLTTGLYDIYFKVYSDGTTSCYISEGRNVEDEPVTPDTPSEGAEAILNAALNNTINATNGTVEATAEVIYDGETMNQSMKFYTDGEYGMMEMAGNTQYSKGAYFLGCQAVELAVSGSFKFGTITQDENGVYHIDTLTCVLSGEKYMQMRGGDDGRNITFTNDGLNFDLTDVEIRVANGYVTSIAYTCYGLSVSGSSTDDVNWEYKFNVRTEAITSYTYKFYDIGTTVIPEPPVEETTMSLAGKTFEIYKVEGYENIPEDMGGPASAEAMIGETITFNEDGTFILTANGVEAYGTYTQDGEKGTYTQKGVYVNGDKMEMPEDLWMTHDIMISGEEIILKSYVGNLDDVNLYPYLYAKLVG